MKIISETPVVILAGGLGTRLREETETKPKPMVEIGGKPILWHIMKHYASFGTREFVICLGYKGELIKEFFLRYRANQGSITTDLSSGEVKSHNDQPREPWTVHLLETGEKSMTGGRIKQAAAFLKGRRFMATYGDGVCDVNIDELMRFHIDQGRQATITAARPPARFGGLTFDGGKVTEFAEKNQINEGWINGGFMVLEPEVAELLRSDEEVLERYPLETLTARNQLSGFQHSGFWQCMDTVRDVTYLRELWDAGSPPWKTWK
ncbi:glucose-1-phosphate cytidylyltransferase [Roseateles albus]|uniref:Glucose-1-phosphate cytidylyltransferase n=1 Tax=Roseateles albus TaxID=2987525 RepID=A0ABT5KIT4_9BURK|nr:glucose-1-phosphate cytidylyltransferase [Roseateles albus]MDC8772741.1 glucose-1-phosphate cytidylyltransferase [Roseateles albus]